MSDNVQAADASSFPMHFSIFYVFLNKHLYFLISPLLRAVFSWGTTLYTCSEILRGTDYFAHAQRCLEALNLSRQNFCFVKGQRIWGGWVSICEPGFPFAVFGRFSVGMTVAPDSWQRSACKSITSGLVDGTEQAFHA